jgi:hypothetical protein
MFKLVAIIGVVIIAEKLYGQNSYSSQRENMVKTQLIARILTTQPLLAPCAKWNGKNFILINKKNGKIINKKRIPVAFVPFTRNKE